MSVTVQFCACAEGSSERHSHARAICGKEAAGFALAPAENGDSVYVKAGLLRRTPMCTSCLLFWDASQKQQEFKLRRAA